MLGDMNAVITLAVKDLKAAKKFYEGVLGLKPSPDQQEGSLNYKTPSAPIMVYESRFAGTNKATAITWIVDRDIENLVKELSAKGVAFEHYDLPNTTRKGDIHVAGPHKLAWFKDPDANIHALFGS